MSCCGKKREEYTGSFYSGSSGTTSLRSQRVYEDIYFEYVGETALTVRGSVSGRTYRFHTKGERQIVDDKDVGGMMAIGVLKRVSSL